MKKRILIVFMCGMLILSFSSSIYAISNVDESQKTTKVDEELLQPVFSIKKINKEYISKSSLSAITDVVYKESIVIDGNNLELYPTFADLKSSIESIKKETGDILSYIKTSYKLDDFSVDTCAEYENVVNDVGGDVYTDAELSRQLSLLNEFFDIYENSAKNKEIEERQNGINENIKNITSEEIQLDPVKIKSEIDEFNENEDKLKELLPYNTNATKLVEDIQSEILDSVSESSTQTGLKVSTYTRDITAGVNYAKKYANNYNTSYASFKGKGGDCTNFVSQIRKTMGCPFDYKYNTIHYGNKGTKKVIDNNKSWFYKTSSNYSVPWVRAAAYSKHFAVKSKYTDFKEFTANATKGTFIGCDWEGDGDCNHMAFVTSGERSADKGKYKNYYNIQIAQHSNEYCAWISDKENGWESIKTNHKNAVFLIVNSTRSY